MLAAPGTIVPGKVASPRQRLSHALAISALLSAAPWHAPSPRLPRPAAATFSVTNLNPAGPGSLRQAILSANLNPGVDLITFAPALNGTINLTTTLRITDSVQIVGPGPGKLSVSAGHAFTVLYVYPSGSQPISTTISGLTLRDGYGDGNISGGIYALGGNLTLDQVDLIDNIHAGRGGAIDYNAEGFTVTLTIRNSLITGNIGNDGGGIYARPGAGGLVIQNTQIVSNTAGFSSGGIYLYASGTALIEDSSILSNTATTRNGGGLRVSYGAGSTTLRRTVISGNTAVNGGGIQFYKPGGDTLVEDSTLAGNHALQRGGGLNFLKIVAGTHTVRRTTLSDNRAIYGAGVYAGKLSAPLLLEMALPAGALLLDRVQPSIVVAV